MSTNRGEADRRAAATKTLREWIPGIHQKACERAHRMLVKWWGASRPDTASLVDRAVCKLLECGVQRCDSREHALNLLSRTMHWALLDILKGLGLRRPRGLASGLTEPEAATRRTTSLDNVAEPTVAGRPSFLALYEALDKLDALSPRLKRVMELRYLIGLSVEETAQEMGLSPNSILNDTRLAKAWLYSALGGTEIDKEGGGC